MAVTVKSVLDDFEQQYQLHKKAVHGLLGLSVGMIIALYCYGKWKETQTTKETSPHE